MNSLQLLLHFSDDRYHTMSALHCFQPLSNDTILYNNCLIKSEMMVRLLSFQLAALYTLTAIKRVVCSAMICHGRNMCPVQFHLSISIPCYIQ